MTAPNISVADAARILAAEPQATNRAVEAAFTALNTANHIYNELPSFGPAQVVPDLDLEMRGFKGRMQGRTSAEAYILATEAEQHFTIRLREAEAMRATAAQARMDFQNSLRLEQIRASQAQHWREQHGRALDTACRELISNVEAIRREIDTASTPEDLEVITAHLVAELHSRTRALNTTNRKKN